MYRNMLTTPVFGLRREIDRLFEDTFANGGERTGWSPAVNIRETDSGFAFEFELAGFRPEDVELTCDNSVLTIRGQRQEERKEGDEGRYHLVERRYGEFTRSFQLPQNVQDDAIEAQFENGLLRVRVPKAELPQPRRIQIQGAEGGKQSAQTIRGTGATQGGGNAAGRKESGSPRAKPQGEMAGTASR